MYFIGIAAFYLILLYLPNFSEGYFIIDDESLLAVPQIAASIPILEKLKTIFKPFLHLDYYPIRDCSYVVDWLWGLNLSVNLLPAKIQNLLWFLLIGVFGVRILRQFQVSERLAGVMMFVFLIHPANAEMLLWVSSRKDLLAIVFFLAATDLFLKTYVLVDSSARRPLVRDHLLVFICFCFSCFSKATFALAPFLLLMYFLIFGSIKNHKAGISFIFVLSLVGLVSLAIQKWNYANGNDMYFDYTWDFRIFAILVALGKMGSGLFYFPAVIVDVENWGEWANLNSSYWFPGVVLLNFFMIYLWWHRKSLKEASWGVLILSVYMVTPGPNIFHRNFFSNRYFSPIFLLGVIWLAEKYHKKVEVCFNQFKQLAFALLIGYCFLVFREAANWQGNMEILGKASESSPNNPSLLTMKIKEEINQDSWQPFNSEQLLKLSEDAKKLENSCDNAMSSATRNGDLCLSFWASSETIQKRKNTLFKGLDDKKVIKYFEVANRSLNNLGKSSSFFVEASSSILSRPDFVRYQAMMLQERENFQLTNQFRRNFVVIYECLKGKKEKAKQLFDDFLRKGLATKTDLLIEISNLKLPHEAKAIRECLFLRNQPILNSPLRD